MSDQIAVPTGDAIEKRYGLEVEKMSSDLQAGERSFKGAFANAPDFFPNMPGIPVLRRRSNFYALHSYGSNSLISGKIQLK